METKKPKARAAKPKEDKPLIRNDKGQFLPGHGGGPGRPPQNVEREYLEATMMACSPQEWARIVRKAVEECEDEDPKVRQMARGFLLKSLLGNGPAVVMQYASIQVIDEKKERKGLTDNAGRWIRRKILGLDKECKTCASRLCDTGEGCDVGEI